jgi:GT2 family glycosyltransferase
MTSPLISVVIPNYNGAACLDRCLRSLIVQTCAPLEIIIVDNASSDTSIEVVRRIAPNARVLPQQRNLGFAAAVNLGIKDAKADWVAILNNDTEVSPDWLEACAAAMGRHPDAAFFASRIMNYSRRDHIYSAGDCYLRAGIGYRRGQEQRGSNEYTAEIPIFAACGCAALVRRPVLEAAQGYDDRFFAYLEDVDLGLRLQAEGMCGYYVPGAVVYHVGGATSGGEFAPLAVRLRTRNALLVLVKSVPAAILMRCIPMILAMQATWFFRVIRHGRLLSYMRGLAGVIPLVPEMLQRRRGMRRFWKGSVPRLWQAILNSEELARRDYLIPEPGKSRFLTWYFRLF